VALPDREWERARRVAAHGAGLIVLAVLLFAAAGAAVVMAFMEAGTDRGVLGHLVGPDAKARALTGGFWALTALACGLLGYSLTVRWTGSQVVRALLKALDESESRAG
jgi:hypothetical protein